MRHYFGLIISLSSRKELKENFLEWGGREEREEIEREGEEEIQRERTSTL